MKKLTNIILIAAAFLFISQVAIQAQTPIDQWGLAREYSSIWPILNDGTTAAGDASMGGDVVSGWKGLQGGFSEMTITTSSALVVKGQIEFVGADAGNAYTPIRYAITYQGGGTTLENALTDSAVWSHQGNHSGYGFHPRTGTGTMSNGNGGQGTVWTIGDGNWASTWSNNGGPVASVLQAPRNAEITEGTYDFAISVMSVNDTTNELRWYMVKTDNKYWYGGNVQVKSTTKKFNSVIFGVNEVEWNQFNVKGMTVEMGSPITVPEAPWEPFYVDQWGLAKEYSSIWPILNDSTTLVGDATIAGDVVSGWKGLQGGFGQSIEFSQDKAFIISGQIKFVGADAGNAYTPIRYALTYQDSNTTLQNALTDSAVWSHQGNHFGYGFHPRTGSGTISNGNGGQGTMWTIGNGNWASTWSNNGGPITTTLQAPRNAEIVAGTYDFAISVQSIDDTTNEIRWYMIEENNKYWFGGTTRAASTTKKFNSIIFGVNEVEWNEFSVIAMEVDKGDPITVPEAPWQAFYVDQWGLAKEYSSIWPILNDSTTLVGDASMGGEVVSGWKGLQGGFGQPITFNKDKAFIISGQIEFVGADAGDAYTPIRYALTYQDGTTLDNALTDSATWSVQGGHNGYGFHPRTGAGTMSNGNGGQGTVWTINGGNWASTYSNNGGPVVQAVQAPRNAEIKAGKYDFAISVQQVDDNTNEIRWYMIAEDNSYWFGGTANAAATTNQFNSIIFGVNEVEFSQFNVIAMEVDKGAPIEVPEPPFQEFYVDDWALVGGQKGDWTLTPGELSGNVSIEGKNDNASGWASLRGTFFLPQSIHEDKALLFTGKMELVGGFEGWNSLQIGFFNSNTPGDLYGNGYLFLPLSGNNEVPLWADGAEAGTVGGVINNTWNIPGGKNNIVLGDKGQYPAGAIASSGMYDFAFSFQKKGPDTEIRYYIHNDTYAFAGILMDDNQPVVTNRFTSFNVGLYAANKLDKTLNLVDVNVNQGDPIDIPSEIVAVEGKNELPTQFALDQNYPNPFNPTTTIEFALPHNSNVKLVVYDILGRSVANLVNGSLTAGYHKVNFNAANLSSGVYFYRIEAGDFVSVKKLMLLK